MVKRKVSHVGSANNKRQKISSKADVLAWLDASKLEELRVQFESNDIGPETFHTITDTDLKDMGVAKMGLRKRFLAAVARDFPGESKEEQQQRVENLPTLEDPSSRKLYTQESSAYLDPVEQEGMYWDLVRHNAPVSCCTYFCVGWLSSFLATVIGGIMPILGVVPLLALVFDARPVGAYVMGIKYIDLENGGRKPGHGKMFGFVLSQILTLMCCCGLGNCPCCCGGNGHQSWLEQRNSIMMVHTKEFSHFQAIVKRRQQQRRLKKD